MKWKRRHRWDFKIQPSNRMRYSCLYVNTLIKSHLAAHAQKWSRILHYQTLLHSPHSDVTARNANIYSRKSSGMISHHQIAAAYQAVIPAVGNPAEAARTHKHSTERVSCNNQLQFTQLFPQSKWIWWVPPRSVRQKQWHKKLQRFNQLRFSASNTQGVNAPNLVKTFVLRLNHWFSTYCLLIVMYPIYLFRL